jgi:hypothetical protein
MANWCYNYITVTGSEVEVARFKATCIKDRGMDFDTIIPMPDTYKIKGGDIWDIEEGVDPEIREARNDWAEENWGTAGIKDWQVDEDLPGRYECRVYNSWSPPLPIFEKLGEMFPWLCFDIKGGDYCWPPEDTYTVTIRGGKFRFEDTTHLSGAAFDEQMAERDRVESAVMSGAKFQIRQLEERSKHPGDGREVDLYRIEVIPFGEESPLMWDGHCMSYEGAFEMIEQCVPRFFSTQVVPVLSRSGEVMAELTLDGRAIAERRRAKRRSAA